MQIHMGNVFQTKGSPATTPSVEFNCSIQGKTEFTVPETE